MKTLKKALVMTMALALIAVCVIGMVSCGAPTPELDLEKAKANLDAAGYYGVEFADYEAEGKVLSDGITSHVEIIDELYIYSFNDKSIAEAWYEGWKKMKEEGHGEWYIEGDTAVGISGSTVWYGTIEAIEASKG